MGYSIYIKTNKKTRDKFYKFLEENMKHVGEELFNSKNLYYRLATNLGYSYCSKGEHPVGFDFNVGSPDRIYIFTIVKWMASKLSQDYFWYDSDKIKFKSVNIKEELKDYAENTVRWKNSIGKKISYKKAYKNALNEKICWQSKHQEKIINFIETEIERLDSLWDVKKQRKDKLEIINNIKK